MSSVFEDNYLRRIVDGNELFHQEDAYKALLESAKRGDKKSFDL